MMSVPTIPQGSGLLEIKLGEPVPAGVYGIDILYGDTAQAL